MRALLASPLGFAIDFALGALGGGGSILAVPALVYAAGQSASDATTTALLVVGGAGARVRAAGQLPARTMLHWFAGLLLAVAGYTGTRATLGLLA